MSIFNKLFKPKVVPLELDLPKSYTSKYVKLDESSIDLIEYFLFNEEVKGRAIYVSEYKGTNGKYQAWDIPLKSSVVNSN